MFGGVKLDMGHWGLRTGGGGGWGAVANWGEGTRAVGKCRDFFTKTMLKKQLTKKFNCLIENMEYLKYEIVCNVKVYEM